MAEFPTMSLKSAPFQFAEFKPVAYTPQEVNLDILNRSMEKIEARGLQARASADALTKATNDTRALLNEKEWEEYDKRIDGYRKQINELTQLGRYSSAIINASDLGRELANDKEIQNKIKTQQSFEQQKQAFLNDKSYNPYTKRRWEALNQYYYDGTGTWSENVHFVEDKDLIGIFDFVVDNTPERQSSTSTSNTGNTIKYTQSDGSVSNTADDKTVAVYSSTTTHNKSTRSVNSKSVGDFYNTLEAVMQDPTYAAALKQQFETMLWLQEDAKNRLANPNLTAEQRRQAERDLATANDSLEYDNGYYYKDAKEWEDWTRHTFRKWADSMQYTNIGTSSERSNITDAGGAGTPNAQINKNAEGYYGPPGDANVQGTSVKTQEKAGTGEQRNANNLKECFS